MSEETLNALEEKIFLKVKHWMGINYSSLTDAEFLNFKSDYYLRTQELKQMELNLKRMHAEYTDLLEKQKKIHLEEVKKGINEFLSKEHPGVFAKITSMQRDLEELLKKAKKMDELMSEKLQKIIRSNSIYKDVYEIRDEMATLRKDVATYTTKFKNLFK